MSLKMAKKHSSKTKGAHRAIAKGHPNTPPTANQNMPCDVFKPPRQFMNAAVPSMAIYMAKLDGRYAALEWKLPGLKIRAIMKKMPTRGFSAKQMDLHINVWQKAQPSARIYRTK